MTIEELACRCKAEVSLLINGHRAVYETIPHYLENMDPDIDSAVLARFSPVDELYELQFYPDTPVGFYRVVGSSLEEVMEKAAAILGATV